MISGSLVGHLLDLLQRAPVDTFLLGGGLGLQLKRHHLGSGAAPGWVEALRQGMFDDYNLLWDAMRSALAIK